jgi:hypothetical protein
MPRHIGIALVRGPATFIATFETERIPFIDSKTILIDSGCNAGVNKTIDGCNAYPFSMKVFRTVLDVLFIPFKTII